MRRWHAGLCAVWVAACGEEQKTPVEIPPEIDDIFRAFDVARKECPDRAWFGYDWSRETILLLDKDADQAWLWRDPKSRRGDSRSAGPLVASTLPLRLRDFSFFTVDTFANARVLGIDLVATRMIDDALLAAGIEQPAPFALHLAVHEAFHFLGGQDDFTPSGLFQRDSEYPEPWRPRFFRRMIIDSLRAALFDGDPDALGRARAWSDALADEYPMERPSLVAVDVYEGTAQYIETVDVLVSRLGCAATDDDLIAQALRFERLFGDGNYSRTSESYALGALSGMLLRQKGMRSFEPLAKIDPLFDILVYEVAPLEIDENAPDAELRRMEAEERVELRNQEAGVQLDPALATWSSTASVRLAVPMAHSLGSFSYTRGYYVGSSSVADHVLLDFSMTIASPDEMGRGDMIDLIAFQPGPNPCDNNVVAFPVPMADIPSDPRISFAYGGITLTDYAVERIDAGGRQWLCLR